MSTYCDYQREHAELSAMRWGIIEVTEKQLEKQESKVYEMLLRLGQQYAKESKPCK